MMAHEAFRPSAERLDTKTQPEADLAVLRVLHRNLSCPFDLFSLGSKMRHVFEGERFQ